MGLSHDASMRMIAMKSKTKSAFDAVGAEPIRLQHEICTM